MDIQLTQAVDSIPLKHSKYCGRIVWDATDQETITFKVEIARKKKAVPRKIYIPLFSEEEGLILGTIELGNMSQLVIANINFTRPVKDFEINFYHPEFPAMVRDFVGKMLKDDKALKKQLEEALSS